MRDRGTFNFSGNLEVKKDAPLEARSLVNSYADLVKPETWTDEQGGIWKYDCMLVSCKDRPGKVYQLSPGADYTKESSWILIGNTSELNSIVQQFIDSKGAPNGLASLNESGIIPSAQLPSYVDDVIEVDTFSNLPGTGESGKIYIVQDTNLTYRWSSTAYVEISKSLALGETSSTAYPGDKGKATTDVVNSLPDNLVNDVLVSQSDKNSVSLTIKSTTRNSVKKNKELSLVDGEPVLLTDNTPILLYEQTGDKLITINQASSFTAGVMSASDKIKLDGLKDQTDITSVIDAVQTNLETHINNKSNPHEVTKDQVGLGNVDNTSDANKPISTATQTALNGKFSATDGNALKQRVDNIPELVATDITVDSDNDSVNISLDKTSIVDGTLSRTTININSATASKAGILVPTDKSKIDKIITNGNGTKYLSDNGTYKEVSGGGESNIYIFSPTISGNGISEQDYNNFKEAANEGKVILVPNTLHDRKISGQFVPINYHGTSTFTLSYIRPLEEADGTLVSDLCMVYIYNTYEIGGTAVRITNAKNLIIPNVRTILRPVSLQGQDAQSKINELFSSAGNFKDVVEDMLVNHTRYYFHFDDKLTNCIELGCVNPWRNDARTSYELHFIVVYDTDNTYYTSKVSVIYDDTDINNTKYHVTNLIQSDNDLLSEIKNLQIMHDNEFNFANDSIGDYVWINYRSRYDSVTSAKAVYVGNGQAGADGAFGAIHASGFFKESDVRLKSNIAPLNHTLDQICNIPTVEFNMHDKHQIGTIAQDLENNFAEVVNTDSDGMKSVDYCMLGVVAIEGIKLLKQEVEDLKKQIQELKNGKQNN